MAEAAEAGASALVGFNYLCNPLFALARDMIAAGEIGESAAFSGIHAEDYMADPAVPVQLAGRDPRGGGALADLGSHSSPSRESCSARSTGPGRHHRSSARRPDGGAGRRRSRSRISAARSAFRQRCSGSIEASRVATAARCGPTSRSMAQGSARLQPGALQRAAFLRTGAPRPTWVPHHLFRAGARALWRLLCRTWPPARLQRSEGYRGRAISSLRSPANRPATPASAKGSRCSAPSRRSTALRAKAAGSRSRRLHGVFQGVRRGKHRGDRHRRPGAQAGQPRAGAEGVRVAGGEQRRTVSPARQPLAARSEP